MTNRDSKFKISPVSKATKVISDRFVYKLGHVEETISGKTPKNPKEFLRTSCDLSKMKTTTK